MGAETLLVDAIVSSANINNFTVANLDEGTDSPGGDWATASAGGAVSGQVGFGSPSGNPSGTITCTCYVRKNASGGNTVTGDLVVADSGGDISTVVSGATISSTTGQLLSGTVDSSSLNDPTAASIELRFVQTDGFGGNPGNRRYVDIDAYQIDLTVPDADPPNEHDYSGPQSALPIWRFLGREAQSEAAEGDPPADTSDQEQPELNALFRSLDVRQQPAIFEPVEEESPPDTSDQEQAADFAEILRGLLRVQESAFIPGEETESPPDTSEQEQPQQFEPFALFIPSAQESTFSPVQEVSPPADTSDQEQPSFFADLISTRRVPQVTVFLPVEDEAPAEDPAESVFYIDASLVLALANAAQQEQGEQTEDAPGEFLAEGSIVLPSVTQVFEVESPDEPVILPPEDPIFVQPIWHYPRVRLLENLMFDLFSDTSPPPTIIGSIAVAFGFDSATTGMSIYGDLVRLTLDGRAISIFEE